MQTERVFVEFDSVVNEGDVSVVVSIEESDVVIPRSLLDPQDDVQNLYCNLPYWFAFKKGLI